MLKQQLLDWHVSESSPHPMFLLIKPKWKYFDDTWFITTPMGHNQLHLIIDKLMLALPHLKDKVMSSKTKRDVEITCMEETLVSCKYDMEIIGHKDLISLEK
jgi:hypothetical protein